MLTNIRDRFTGLFAVLIIGAIGVALTITLVDTSTFTGVANFAARVNGEDIPLRDFRQVAQQQILEQEQLTRAEMPPEARRQIEQNVLEGMVRNRVVAQYVKEQGYRVSDGKVIEHIRTLPGFQVGGQFSNDGYMAALASQGVSPTTFEEERRAALQIEQLQNGLLESSFFTPAEYRRFVVLEGERRRAAFALLSPDQLLAGITLSEEDLKAYYDGHPDQFESPETVALDYVEARLADLAPAGEVSEAELRATYEANPERFSTAEQRRARHILVAVDQDTDDAAAARLAAELRGRLDKGEDFAALARQYSDDPGSAAQGGDLGWAGKGTYVAPFEAALFAAAVGETTQPVKTDFGYHIIRLEEIRAGARRPFEEVREELAREAGSQDTEDRFFELTEKMDDAALENPGSLDAVAAATGLPVRRIEQFPREGAEPFVGNRAIIDAAFSAPVLEDGENSALIEAEDGRAVILRVVEHRPARLRPLEEVRAEVEKAARAEKAAQLAAERGRALLERVRAGDDFATAARGAGTTATATQLFGRASQEAPPELVAAIFRAPRPTAGAPSFGTAEAADGTFAVFRIDEVIPGNPDDIPREQRDARKSILARQSAVAEVTALAVDLRRDADVMIAPGLFDQQDDL
jgi:peptidyl-prolyl cis-trans isomerase D